MPPPRRLRDVPFPIVVIFSIIAGIFACWISNEIWGHKTGLADASALIMARDSTFDRLGREHHNVIEIVCTMLDTGELDTMPNGELRCINAEPTKIEDAVRESTAEVVDSLVAQNGGIVGPAGPTGPTGPRGRQGERGESE